MRRVAVVWMDRELEQATPLPEQTDEERLQFMYACVHMRMTNTDMPICITNLIYTLCGSRTTEALDFFDHSSDDSAVSGHDCIVACAVLGQRFMGGAKVNVVGRLARAVSRSAVKGFVSVHTYR